MALPGPLAATSSPGTLAKPHPVALHRSHTNRAPQRPSHRIYANNNNEPAITSFNISPPGDINALWNDDDVLEVPSLRDQLYPRSALNIFISNLIVFQLIFDKATLHKFLSSIISN